MRRIIVGMLVIFLLTACGTPGPATDETSDTIEEPSTEEVVDSAAQNTSEPSPPLTEGVFTQRMESSINEVLFGENDAADFTLIGALEVDGLLYIYLHNGSEIYYAVSSNGSDWALSPEPIFTGLYNNDFEYFPASIQATHEGFAIYCGSATVNYAQHDYLYSIWIISAPEPTGPWTLGDFPSLVGWHTDVEEPIPFHVAHPIVRPYQDGYRMYYAYSFTLEEIKTPGFAVAHSWDGLIWRYTPDLPTPEMSFDTYPLHFAEDYAGSVLMVLDIWPTQAGWQMLYLVEDDEAGAHQIYLAESENGLQWGNSDVDIQLPPDLLVEDIVSASLLNFQGEYLLFYCAMPESHQFQCYIAVNDSGS